MFETLLLKIGKIDFSENLHGRSESVRIGNGQKKFQKVQEKNSTFLSGVCQFIDRSYVFYAK